MSIHFVAEPWTSTFDAAGVTITYRSGDDVTVTRMRRADYRRGLETELQRLNEYETAERRRVVPFKQGKRAGH